MARIIGFAGGAFIYGPDDAGEDTTPAAFDFSDQAGVLRSTVITSAPVTPTGYDTPAAISVTGGEYDLDSAGAWTSTPGTINPGQTVRARNTSSASYLTPTHTDVTIGGVTGRFTNTTLGNPANASNPYQPFSFRWHAL